MRYMLIRKADADTENGVMPSEQLLQAMADYNERMLQAGVFIAGDGVRPSREGCRITFQAGEPTVTKGPFEQTGELLAGYSVLEADSLEDAIAWARQWPPEDAGGNVTLELRRYYTMADFEPGAALEKHRSQRQLPSEVNVHLTFAGNCREAMTFYEAVTGGQLEAMITVGDTPAADEAPSERHGQIIHASLNIRGRRLMGADMMEECFQPIQGAQVYLQYDDPEQAERVFGQLAEGGSVFMPFEKTFWAHRFGMATDRFGVQWMISCQLEPCL